MSVSPAECARALQLHSARKFLDSLPHLGPTEIPEDETCPICLNSFVSIMHGESEPVDDEPQELGVIKLTDCGHIFCKRDILEWVDTRHGSCPTCRHVFLDIPSCDSDNESSDGGEYIPGDDMDEDTEIPSSPHSEYEDSEWSSATTDDDLDLDDVGYSFGDETRSNAESTKEDDGTEVDDCMDEDGF